MGNSILREINFKGDFGTAKIDKSVKMVVRLISRKIWVPVKLWNFHTVEYEQSNLLELLKIRNL